MSDGIAASRKDHRSPNGQFGVAPPKMKPEIGALEPEEVTGSQEQFQGQYSEVNSASGELY